MNSCPICRGAGSIRLPVHHELSLTPFSSALTATEIVESSRLYACPECKSRDLKGARLLQAAASTDKFTVEQSRGEVLDYIKRNAVYELAAELEKSGAVQWEETRKNDRVYIRGVIAVASNEAAAHLDKEVSARASEMVEGITEDAAHQILNWGSAYTGPDGMISKAMAVEFMSKSFSEFMSKARQRLDV